MPFFQDPLLVGRCVHTGDTVSDPEPAAELSTAAGGGRFKSSPIKLTARLLNCKDIEKSSTVQNARQPDPDFAAHHLRMPPFDHQDRLLQQDFDAIRQIQAIQSVEKPIYPPSIRLLNSLSQTMFGGYCIKIPHFEIY